MYRYHPFRDFSKLIKIVYIYIYLILLQPLQGSWSLNAAYYKCIITNKASEILDNVHTTQLSEITKQNLYSTVIPVTPVIY